MATEFIAANGQDLDNVFELLSEYPRLPVGTPVNYYSSNNLDLSARYVRNVGGLAPEVGMRQYFPASGGYTEVINEGGEIIEIYYPPIPASEQDLSSVFAAKGSVAAYYNHPFVGAPLVSQYELTKYSTVPAGSSGNISSTNMFTFDVPGSLINADFVINAYTVISSSLIAGSIYSALNESNPVRRLDNLYSFRKLYSVGLRTTTAYTNGAGISEARLRLSITTHTSAGYSSNGPESPHTGKKVAIFDVVLRHSVSAKETGQ